MICAIPESVGWAIVGALGASAIMMAVALGRIIYRAIRYRVDDDFDM